MVLIDAPFVVAKRGRVIQRSHVFSSPLPVLRERMGEGCRVHMIER
jgi:hypothetical protein